MSIRHRFRPIVPALMVAFSLAATNAIAQVEQNANARHQEYWSPADLPLTYVIHEDGAPFLVDGSDFTAIQQGFNAWTSLTDVELTASYAGTTTQAAGDGLDEINLVSFQDPSFVAIYGNAVLAVGLTTSFTEPTEFGGRTVLPGQIVDADILFNPNRSFSTESGGSGPDLRSVIAHEAGHLWGFSHSSVVSSTMFPALPGGIAARSLETDDQVLAYMGYPDPTTLSGATRLEGSVTLGNSGAPLPGAAVFAVSAATGDTLGSNYTLPDGSFRFVGMPAGDYYVWIHPLDGTAGVNGVVPRLINELVETTAITIFLPEWWDAAESNADDPAARDAISLIPGVATTGIDLITNVDAIPPTISEVFPRTGSGDVRADALLALEFSEPIDFGSARSNFHLDRIDEGGRTGVAGSLVSISPGDKLIFDPTLLLEYGAQYELTIGAELTDQFGNRLGLDQVFGFFIEEPPPLSINSISPTLLAEGTLAVIDGVGFDVMNPANNVVDFGGVSQPATLSSPSSIVVRVPEGIPLSPFDVQVTVATESSNLLTATGLASFEIARGALSGAAELSTIPRSLALLPDGNFAYVATDLGLSSVVTATSSPDYLAVTDIGIDGGTVDVVTTPDGTRGYAVSRGGQRLIVLDTNYGDLLNPNESFNTVLDELPVEGTPLGVTVDPAGQRVFISLAEGLVQMWDVRLGNSTFHRPIGEVALPATPSGPLAVDRAGSELYALTTAGDLAVYQIGDFTSADPSPPQIVTVGTTPIDLTLDPSGELIYVVDAADGIVVVERGGLTPVISVGVSGSPGAFAVSPAGGLGYLANRSADAVQVVGLEESRTGYFSVANSFDVGLRPADLAVSPDGAFTYVIEEGSLRLSVLGIGFGPVVQSIVPTFAQAGDIVVIAGSGFAPSDPSVPEVPPASRVYFDGAPVVPESSTGLDLWVRVPDGFNGGTIRVGTDEERAGAGLIELLSNPAVLGKLSAPPNDPAEQLLPAVFLDPGSGYMWSEGGVAGVLRVSPDGRTMLAADADQTLAFIDVDQNSARYGEVLATYAMPLYGLKDLTFSADNRRAYLMFGQNDPILVVNTDRLSPDFGALAGEIDFSWIPDFCFNPKRLLTHPNGDILVVEDVCNEMLYCFDARAAGTHQQPLLAISDPELGTAEDVVLHPSGRALYYASANGSVLVFDFDPYSSTYLEQVAALENGDVPRALGITPDGGKLLVVTRSFASTGNHVLEAWDTSNPTLPALLTDLVLEEETSNVTPSLAISPNGDRAVVDLSRLGAIYLDIRDEAFLTGSVELDRIFLNDTTQRLGLSFGADANRFFSAALGDPGIVMVELTGGIQANLLSGGDQTGVAGRTLPAPIRYQVVSQETGLPVPNATAEVRIAGGGGTLGNGETYQWLASDSDGTVEVLWTLGPEPDPDPTAPTNQLAVTFAAGSTVADSVIAVSVAAPEELPLDLLELRPEDGLTEVSSTTSIQTVFSRAIERESISPTTMYLERVADGTTVDTVFGFADGERRVSLIPLAPLDETTTYSFVITGGVQDLSGGAVTNPATITFTTEGPPELITRSVNPPASQVNVEVVIGGEGFDPVPGNNVVSFSGTATTGLAVTANSLRVIVPVGAVSGDLTVEANGQISDPLRFDVLAPQEAPLDDIIKTEPTGVNVRSIAALPDGSKAYAASQESDTVVPLDLVTLETLPSIDVGDMPVALAAHPIGNTLYSANFGSNDVSVIDTTTDTLLESIDVGESPYDIVAAPAGDRLYVVNVDDETLSVIDIGAGNATYHTVVATVPTGSTTQGAAITPDGGLLYLGTTDGFIVIDLTPSSYGVVATVPTGSTTQGAAITPDGSLLILVTATGDLLFVDITESGNNAVVATVPTGSTTQGAAITPDGSLLYVFSQDSDDILVYAIEVAGSVGVLPTADALGQLVIDLDLVETFQAGRNPEFIAFDPTGSGLGIVSNGGQETVTFFNASSQPFDTIEGELFAEPRTLNLDSNGRFVKATIELPAGYFVRNIDLATVRLQGTVPADLDRVSYQDEDQDGLEEIVMKFDRSAFQEQLPQGEFVPVEVGGQLTIPDRAFTSLDTIRTIRPTVLHPRGGEVLFGGSTTLITWASPQGYSVSAVDVHFTCDDGETWTPLALGIEDAGFINWEIPQEVSSLCRVMVTLYDQSGDDMGMGMSADSFTLSESPVPIALQGVEVAVVEGDGFLRWEVVEASQLRGFHVLRAERREGNYQRMTEIAIRASQAAELARFEFRDDSVYGNQEYWYLLEEELADGQSGFQHGPFKLVFEVQNRLDQNFPNSFNPRTTIRFAVAKEAPTRLVIYDLAGRVVRVLIDERLKPDVYRREWDGTDARGRAVASGVYVYRLETENFVAAKKMALVR